MVSLTDWSMTEILAAVLFSCRSTPHVTTNETPFRVLTGEDMCLPHFQNWATNTGNFPDIKYRLQAITLIRKEAFEH